MRHAKSPAQQKGKNAASGALIEAEGCLELLRYTAPVGLIPSWADLAFGRGVPPESSIPLLYLLYYHKADVTSQTFALCSQNDVLHDAYQFNGRKGPKTVTPSPRRPAMVLRAQLTRRL